MKVALNVSEDSGDSDANIFTDENINRIERVLEQEIHELMPNFCEFDSCEISVMITTPENIRELNRTYRNIDEATDVLSFPMIDINQDINQDLDFVCPVLALGDIVICPSEVSRLHPDLEFHEAMYLMIAHSFLHLLGWDHDTREKESEMWQRQEVIKNKFLANNSEVV